MRLGRRVLWLVLFSAPLVFSALAPSLPDVRATALAVDRHYNHLRSLRAQFTESYRGAGVERVEEGTLSLKKPGKMRWQYRSPTVKLFVGDGKQAWFYVPGDQQARKTAMKKLDDVRSPLSLLLGKSRLEKELQGLSLAPDVAPLDPSDVILRGTPEALGDRVRQVTLEINSRSQICRILIDESDDSVTEYRFRDQQENIALPDDDFRFEPPAGVEVIEGEFGP
jgi:outer membrane lipoprotein carrier protein